MGAFEGGVPLEDQPREVRPQGNSFGGVPLEEDTTLRDFDVSSMRQEATNVRQPGYGPEDLATRVGGLFTGNNRREFDLPEFDLPFEFKTRQAKTAAGLMSTFDPKREVQVLRNNYPDLKFAQDRFGNIMVDGSAYGGEKGYMNNPGISPRDLLEAGFQVAAFTPAGRAGAVATGAMGRMAAVGGTAAATEAAMDETARGMAGQDTSLGETDVGNVAIAGVGGGAFEGIGIMLGKALKPAWKASDHRVTDEIRQVFYEEARKAGQDINQVTDDVIKYYMDAAENAIDPRSMPAVADTGEFGIRYTKGQATGELPQLRLEERLRTGPSEAASGVMERFRSGPPGQPGGQKQQIMDARGRVQADIAGQQPTITSPADAGEAIVEGVRGRSAAALREVDEAYGDVGQASLLPQGQRGLVTRLERTARANQFITDRELAPATARAMEDVRALRDYIDERGGLLSSQPMRHIERVRRKLNKYIDSAKTKEDKRQTVMLKREFDSYLDRAVDNALFSGDEDALKQLKKGPGSACRVHAQVRAKLQAWTQRSAVQGRRRGCS